MKLPKLPEGTPILNMNDPGFLDNLISAIGGISAGPIQIVTPQFDRNDGLTTGAAPASQEEWDALPAKTDAELVALGMGRWSVESDVTHWLYPKEWYPHIPAGMLIITINEEIELFQPGETDDDHRFGMLAYGFKKLTES